MRDRLLTDALAGNALFSAGTGIILLGASASVGERAGIGSERLLALIGALLVGFAVIVTTQAVRRWRTALGPVLVSLADIGWVVGTAVILAVASDAFTRVGVTLMLAVAGVVGGFALAQLVGIARSYGARGAAAGSYRVCVEVESGSSADTLWRAVGDLGEISRFASSLADSRLRGNAAPGVGAVRECRDGSGHVWAERCTLYEADERRYEVEFLTGEPGFPFPFCTMTGGWSVEKRPDGAAVRISWNVTPKRRFLAAFILPAMDHTVRRSFPDTIQRMAAAEGGVDAYFTVTPSRSRLSAIGC